MQWWFAILYCPAVLKYLKPSVQKPAGGLGLHIIIDFLREKVMVTANQELS